MVVSLNCFSSMILFFGEDFPILNLGDMLFARVAIFVLNICNVWRWLCRKYCWGNLQTPSWHSTTRTTGFQLKLKSNIWIAYKALNYNPCDIGGSTPQTPQQAPAAESLNILQSRWLWVFLHLWNVSRASDRSKAWWKRNLKIGENAN